MKSLFPIIASVIILLLLGCSKDKDVKMYKSGLKYLDEINGEGREANQDNLLTVNYRAWIIHDSIDLYDDWTRDTTKFPYLVGDSYARKQKIKFNLGENAFINGLDEGLIGMKAGGKRTIIIPSKLAYGKQGMGPIPPNSDLKVEVELLEVKDRITAKMWDVDPAKMNTTESGLKYAIIKLGEGKFPSKGNAVMIQYTGYLEDSTKFDSSVERDEPLEFVVGTKQVIDGLDEGVRLLRVGGKARLILPPSIAYGNVALPKIPANSTLIFDLELLDVK
jgi:FKBP-type peptidyl-prolyl cis-trans isomerase